MILKQVSVFLESRKGKLAPVIRHLGERGINLRALMLAETDRFGILRFIPDDAEAALAAVHELGNTARISEVIGIEVDDRPGGLADILAIFDDSEVSVQYLYAELASGGGQALLVLKLDPIERAQELLAAAGLPQS
ncbi:hypothetical protein [Propionicimonas sp.]|uniref:hypothetical protein n=1 Tax=Propionicimonas sp. TaxID=1955623 RepID=UPI0017C3F474|nr:hypothetical protein [Propionicimonas sp.]MBU3976082.1 hypothetical protein [Actinomycetota bacterium]MBA3020895.1 hypothetical protein [Propionicimonas sp.]MBU3985272.1 hypothetical protein [Actinomycetota bacterium]MBU4008262.1 hypothetical protein [Actinomycetota bacterium]MBU4064524.1 hypothetical protein [Actinomycetota bacterium]